MRLLSDPEQFSPVSRKQNRLQNAGLDVFQVIACVLMTVIGVAVSMIISDMTYGRTMLIPNSYGAGESRDYVREVVYVDAPVIAEPVTMAMPENVTGDGQDVEKLSSLAGKLLDLQNEVGKSDAENYSYTQPALAEPETTAISVPVTQVITQTVVIPAEQPVVPAAAPAVQPQQPSAAVFRLPVANMDYSTSQLMQRQLTTEYNLSVANARTAMMQSEPVYSGNSALYLPNYWYGAPTLPKNGLGYVRLNSQGVPMSELAMPSNLVLDQYGVPINYLYYLDGKVTAYDAGPMTATGTDVYQGCVAVDPRIIPYGTEMWITSSDGLYLYGYCRAEDTGGFIYYTNGALADLYMYSYDDCDEWGWRDARIYILPSTY